MRNRHEGHLVDRVMIGMGRMVIRRELRVYVVGVLRMMLSLVGRSGSVHSVLSYIEKMGNENVPLFGILLLLGRSVLSVRDVLFLNVQHVCL
jgi:hypothetical protein